LSDRICPEAEIGYDAEWTVLSAAEFGAPHLRKRVFIVAYTESIGVEGDRPSGFQVAQAPSEERIFGCDSPPTSGWWSAQCRLGKHPDGIPGGMDCGGWECGIPRTTKDQKERVNRLRCLGNAVVPQIAEWIGDRILTEVARWRLEGLLQATTSSDDLRGKSSL
jgi:DNA (cytosine-5)-methyltransferase 1